MRVYTEIYDPETDETIRFIPASYAQRTPEQQKKDIVIGGTDIKA
jgi:hypothetical protein